MMLSNSGVWNKGLEGSCAATTDAINYEARQPSLYANEEILSLSSYPSGYAAKSTSEQIMLISQSFGLDGTNALSHAEKLSELPAGAEAWFAIPKWHSMANSYGEALEKVLEKLAGMRSFENWRRDDLQNFRQSDHSMQMLARISKYQAGDILIVPAQFGFRHRGRSTRRAREVFVENEFGLGAFEVGCLLLSHPEREQITEQLHIYCAGDEFFCSPDMELAPAFCWQGGILHLLTYLTSHISERFGSASGFVSD